MAEFSRTMTFRRSAGEVFDFFVQSSNWVALSPPELHLTLAEGPSRLEVGSILKWKGRRWGIPHRVVSEVTAVTPGELLTLEQRQGPFKQWVHTLRLEPSAEGCRLHEHIAYEPPGGLLGLVVTQAFVEKDLEANFRYRTEKLREMLGE